MKIKRGILLSAELTLIATISKKAVQIILATLPSLRVKMQFEMLLDVELTGHLLLSVGLLGALHHAFALRDGRRVVDVGGGAFGVGQLLDVATGQQVGGEGGVWVGWVG